MGQGENSNKKIRFRRLAETMFYPWITLIFSLTLVLAIFNSLNRKEKRIDQALFENRTEILENRIRERMNNNEVILNGCAGLITSSEKVTWDEWASFSEVFKSMNEEDGILAISFARILRSDDLDSHIEQMKHLGFSEYRIYPFAERDYYLPIDFVAPVIERNKILPGYDLLSEPGTRIFVEKALKSDKAVLSDIISLPSESTSKIVNGFRLMKKVKSPGDMKSYKNEDIPEAAMVFLSVSLEVFMGEILFKEDNGVAVDLFYTTTEGSIHKVYDFRSDARCPALPENFNPLYQREADIDLIGQQWHAVFTSLPRFESLVKGNSPYSFLVFGFIISILFFRDLANIIRNSKRHRVAEERLKALSEALEQKVINRTTSLSRINSELKSEIEARKRIESELQLHKDHLEELVKDRTLSLSKAIEEVSDLYENAPCGYHSFSLDGTILRINRTELNWLGYSKEEVIGKKKITDILSPPFVEIYKKHFPDFLRTGYLRDEEIELVRKDGTTFYVSVNATLIRGDKGKAIMSNASLFDITRRKKAEELLVKAKLDAENANKVKSQFLANMSHEIRTPMNAILGYSEILESAVTDKNHKEFISSIKSSGVALLSLINSILDLSKIEAGKMDLDFSCVNSRRFFHEFRQIFSLKANEKDIAFNILINSHIPEFIYIDESRLRQIIINLAGNAVKFTNAGSVYLIIDQEPIPENDSRKDDAEGSFILKIEVEDTGIGIPENMHDDIFNPFVQVGRKRKTEGTGLGLAITKNLIRLMNGSIDLKSEPGKGSTFIVKIPCVQCDVAPKDQHVETMIDTSEIHFKTATLLIVDDIECNRSVIRDILRTQPLKIIEAENGLSAMEMIDRHTPDLIIADIRLPDFDGFELLSRIKSGPAMKHIPVLAYTASIMEFQKKIKESDFAGLLVKPISKTELFASLMNILSYEKKEKVSIKEPENNTIIEKDILINVLQSDLMAKWEEFRTRQPIKDIIQFSEILILLGDKHNAKRITSVGKDLKNAANTFNIDAILRLLKEFPGEIENLKKQITGHE